jgi:hypothetical protein
MHETVRVDDCYAYAASFERVPPATLNGDTARNHVTITAIPDASFTCVQRHHTIWASKPIARAAQARDCTIKWGLSKEPGPHSKEDDR